MSKQTAAPATKQKRPAHWDKRVSAAYLRMLGHTQAAAAKAVGRSERSLRGWEADAATWEDARAEARVRWLSDAEDAARMVVLSALKGGHAEMGFRILERIDPKLAPPRQRFDLATVDLSRLSDAQLQRIRDGEDPIKVVGDDA